MLRLSLMEELELRRQGKATAPAHGLTPIPHTVPAPRTVWVVHMLGEDDQRYVLGVFDSEGKTAQYGDDHDYGVEEWEVR